MIQLTFNMPEAVRLYQKEVCASSFIPYACHYNDETILTRNGELIQFLRVQGFAAENADLNEVDFRKTLRNVLFKSIANPQYALWFHTIRKRQRAYPEGGFSSGFTQDLNSNWKKKSHGHPFFENQLTISIVRQSQGGTVRGFQNLLDAISHRADHANRRDELAGACRDLTDVRRRFEAALADYGPRALTIRRSPKGRFSEPQAFLSRLLNLEDRPVLVSPMDISRYLPTKRLFFGPNAIECRGATGRKLAAIICIKEYGAETAAGMLDRFFELPFEWVISQSFLFCHRQAAVGKMQKQQRLLEKSEDPAVSQMAEIGQALDDASSGAAAFGDHHLTVMPVAESLEELNDAVAAIESELMNLGIMSVREDLNMEPAYWAQLPANAQYIARRSTLSTANLAGFASLHNFPSGRLTGNHWGPAVTVLETQSGTPYFFNFHVGDVGHTTIMGPTGSGKTVLVNFLCAQAQKYRCRLFFFDKDRGAEIFVRAIGGTYSILGGGQSSGFNPLQLPDTAENRTFLIEWLQSLVTTLNEPFTSQDLDRISHAVSGNFKLAPEDRTLAKIAPFLGMPGPGTLAGRLAMWHSDGALKNLFGSERDVLNLSNRIAGFEMGPILQSRQALAPVLLYLFHRIHLVLDGTPTMIVLDEAWALLDNPVFAPKIKDWLKTLRKLNALVVFSTQSVEDASKSSISDTLVQQSATQIYLPNAKATDTYRTAFKVTERELQIVRELDPASRSFLIKQGKDAVVARLDLSGMKEAISVLSGRAETVRKLDAIRARVGDDPAVWLPIYLEVENEHHIRAA
jgi:type IV secretion system protein VirB4